MKDFLVTLKSFPDIVKYAMKTYKYSLKQSRWYLITYITLSVILTFVPYTRNFIQGSLINSLQNSLQINYNLIVLFFIFIAVIIIPSFLEILKNFTEKIHSFKSTQFYDNELTRKATELDPQLHEDKEFNNLKNRISSKGVYILNNYQAYFELVFFDLLTLIISSATLYHFSRRGFLVLIITTLPILFVKIIYGQRSWYIWGNEVDTEKRSKYWEYKDYFEKFSTYVELKLTRASNYFSSFRSGFLQEVFDNQNKTERTLVRKGMVASIVSQAGIVYVIYFLFTKVVAGELQIGSFIFALSLVTTFTVVLIHMFSNLGSLYPDYKYVKDFFTYMETEPIIKNLGKEKISQTPPIIEFKDVSFKYPNTEKYVLKDFNLMIEAGDKLAVIGLNGAGKTTFVKLLCRFYDPTEGQILLNGKDLRKYDLENWYEQLGVLFQEYGKYHIPIKNLVSLGRNDKKIDVTKIKNSLKIAEADFVQSLPNKESTMLGKHYTDGVDISVGQWQKLAIARMFYRDPAVMILDEPTSSIDAEAEAKIFETLEKLTKDKTVIMISHRFSTVRNADKICVIKDGVLHEYGTHEELLAIKSGEYARLFNLQAEGYK